MTLKRANAFATENVPNLALKVIVACEKKSARD
jgi:hypothetical protein